MHVVLAHLTLSEVGIAAALFAAGALAGLLAGPLAGKGRLGRFLRPR